MNKQTRLLALFILLLPTLEIAAQSIKPIPALVQRSQQASAGFFQTRLFEKAEPANLSAARFAQFAQFLNLNSAQLQQLLAERPEKISLTLPYNEETLTIDLVQTPVLTPDFKLHGNLRESMAFLPGLHYRGMLRGNDQSMAAFSFFDAEVMGFISDYEHNNLVMGKVQQAGNEMAYMLYSDQELAMDNPFECIELESKSVPLETAGLTDVSDKSIRVYLEADHLLFANRGGVQNTYNYLAGIFNQIAAIYWNEQVNLVLSEMFIWETPDPYALANSKLALEQFRLANTKVAADLIHLVGMNNYNPEGIADADALCNSAPAAGCSNVFISYSNVPTYSWTVGQIAHEIGHNLGARHTQWCGWPGGAIDQCYTSDNGCSSRLAPTNGSTIMSHCYQASNGANFIDGLGPLPGNAIRNRIQQAACLLPLLPANDLKPISGTNPVSGRSQNDKLQSTLTDMAGEEILLLTPNPARERVSVNLHFDKEILARVNLLDMIGRPVTTQTVNLRSGALVFELGHLPKGVYLVQVVSNDQILATKRLIKE